MKLSTRHSAEDHRRRMIARRVRQDKRDARGAVAHQYRKAPVKSALREMWAKVWRELRD